MNLIVDIGNTLVKLAVFDGGRIVAQRCVERLHPSMLGELLEGRRAAKAVVASTRGEADDVIETVRPYADYLLEFTSQTPVPVANAYHTPETLGRDRLAAAVGAPGLYPVNLISMAKQKDGFLGEQALVLPPAIVQRMKTANGYMEQNTCI